MSGIVGIWNLDARPVEKAVLSRLSATLAHRGPDGEGLRIEGPVGLACQLLRVTPESLTETQPCIDPSGVALVFDGRLDNREELLEVLKASSDVSAESPDPILILTAYNAFQDRFPEHLNGDFALGLFDPKRQQLLLARDALGVRPLYYCRTGDTFLFASEIKALLAHPGVRTRPNDDMLAKCVFGEFEQEDQWSTCFEGVSSLAPSHMAILTRGGFATRRYWDFDPARRIRLGSFPEYVEAFRHHFEQAVRRRLRSAYPVAVALSGGLDSSSVFCVAQSLKRANSGGYPSTFGVSNTFPEGSPSDERVFLTDIERQYGISVERMPVQPIEIINGSREQLWHVETPFLTLQWNIHKSLLQKARQLGARVLLTGYSGDQMLVDGAYLVDLFRQFAWIKTWRHLREIPRWLTDAEPGVFTRNFLRNLVGYHVPAAAYPMVRRLKAKWSRSPADPSWYTETFRRRAEVNAKPETWCRSFSTAYATSMYCGARSTYDILACEWYNKGVSMGGLEVATPYLDRDLISFLIGIPGEVQCWNGVLKALLRQAMRGVLPPSIAGRRTKGDLTEPANRAVERDFQELVHRLGSPGMAVKCGYVRSDKIGEELTQWKERIAGPNFVAGSRLLRLAGLELWLETFLNEENKEKEGLYRGKAN